MVFFDKQRTAKQDVSYGSEALKLGWRQSSIEIIIFLQLSRQWIVTIHKVKNKCIFSDASVKEDKKVVAVWFGNKGRKQGKMLNYPVGGLPRDSG